MHTTKPRDFKDTFFFRYLVQHKFHDRRIDIAFALHSHHPSFEKSSVWRKTYYA